MKRYTAVGVASDHRTILARCGHNHSTPSDAYACGESIRGYTEGGQYRVIADWWSMSVVDENGDFVYGHISDIKDGAVATGIHSHGETIRTTPPVESVINLEDVLPAKSDD